MSHPGLSKLAGRAGNSEKDWFNGKPVRDHFPTPPWVTRALLDCPEIDLASYNTLIEPCCGEGHMVRVLEEYRRDHQTVVASDLYDYGGGYEVRDALQVDYSAYDRPLIVTNPPYSNVNQFIEKLIEIDFVLLIPLKSIVGIHRYERIYSRRKPNVVMVFPQGVRFTPGQLCQGKRWVKGKGKMMVGVGSPVAWFCWLGTDTADPLIKWFPPGARTKYERVGDYDRADAPRLDLEGVNGKSYTDLGYLI